MTRLEQYLAHIKGETTACTQVQKEVMEMMNQHLCEAKKLKIQEKKKANFYDIRRSNRYDEGEDKDGVEADLLQVMRESRKTAYTDEWRQRSVSGFPSNKQYMPGGSSSFMLERYGSMRDNPINLGKEAMRA